MSEVAAPATSKSRPAAQQAPGSPAGTAQPSVAPERLAASVEAALLSSSSPLSLARLVQALGLSDPAAATQVRASIDELNRAYEETARSYRIEQVAGGWRAVALAEFGPVVTALHGQKESHTLSRPAVETLAIIAYRQPITRADLESIRGVACGEVLRSLLEKKLIDIVGRAEELGRPMLYGTTRRFLEVFHLASIRDLPNHQDFAPPASSAGPRRSVGASQPDAPAATDPGPGGDHRAGDAPPTQ
ncbi:MAG: SMC-Scp complex subunit ScpB [Planctomycetota bacterium]|nr:SMC-Scp complex subunit ScpB [Planctomycetota bacterium]